MGDNPDENLNENLTENLSENLSENLTDNLAAEPAENAVELPPAAPASAVPEAFGADFWRQDSWWDRHFGFMSGEAKFWFLGVLLLMICGGFYLGFWGSMQEPRPIDVPYVTSANYFADKAAAEAAMKNYLGDDGVLTVLLLGCDMREGERSGRSDTIMLAFIDLEEGAVNL